MYAQKRDFLQLEWWTNGWIQYIRPQVLVQAAAEKNAKVTEFINCYQIQVSSVWRPASAGKNIFLICYNELLIQKFRHNE